MLCERGIRTFEDHTRFTLPLATVPYLHQKTHLPVIVDPSHGTGKASLVATMAVAAVAAGADGLIVEIHPQPGEGAERRLPGADAGRVPADDGRLPQGRRGGRLADVISTPLAARAFAPSAKFPSGTRSILLHNAAYGSAAA